MNDIQNPPPDGRDLSYCRMDVGMSLLLTLVTCGLYNLYWNYRQMEACNELLERKEFDFVMWLVLCFVTCGLYHFYYQYKMGSVIVEIQHKYNKPAFDNLPMLSALLTLFLMSIIVDCIHQNEINKLTY